MATRPPALQSANDIIDRAVSISPYFLAWVSGGKDSACVTSLLCEAKKRHPQLQVVGLFLYHVRELSFLMTPIRALTGRYGIPLIELPHWALSYWLSARWYRDPSPIEEQVYETKMIEVEFAARVQAACLLSGISRDKMWKEEPCTCDFSKRLRSGKPTRGWQPCGVCNNKSGMVKKPAFKREDLVVAPEDIWSAKGERLDDSPQRRGMLTCIATGNNPGWRNHASGVVGLDLRYKRIYPLAHWRTRDVFAYMRAMRLPAPPRLGALNQTGMGLRPQMLRAVKAHYPADYEKIVRQHPQVEAQVRRGESD